MSSQGFLNKALLLNSMRRGPINYLNDLSVLFWNVLSGSRVHAETFSLFLSNNYKLTAC